MYAPNTILELKEPKSTEDKPFAYDRVRVVGPSPVDAGVRPSSWTGGDAQGVIIEPLSEFGAFLDEPFGKLILLYKVIEEPKVEIDGPQKIRVIDSSTAAAGKTPEEVFATDAPGEPSKAGERVRTPISPLEDPRSQDEGPLGKVTPPVIDGQRTEVDLGVSA